MKRSETTNVFSEGLVMDLNPLVTPNNVVTNCLNGTLITYNGNENVLLNDMGNGRVESAYLPEGYVPVGTAELGGIIYIVSYNPLENKCLIGSFPSPERNITSDELGDSTKTLFVKDFYSDTANKMIKSPLKKLLLTDKELHPNDKFQIYCTELTKDSPIPNYISAKEEKNYNADKFPRYLKLNVVAILDNGKINNLNNTLVWNNDNNYYIIKDAIGKKEDGITLNVDEYRNLIESNYNVFNSDVDGKLAILALLECIDTFDVSWDAIKKDDKWNFYFYLNWSYENDDLESKNKINLYNIKVECEGGESKEFTLEDYPNNNPEYTDNDILKNKDTIFYTPYYVDSIEEKSSTEGESSTEGPDYSKNNGIKVPRRNDGTDNLYLLYKPYILKEDAKGIVNFTIYPGMPFGYLEYLKQTFSVDLSKLGSGAIDLKEYRYWFDPQNITLNWALEAYPERNKRINSVKFNFYKFNQDIYNWICNNEIDTERVTISKGLGGAWEMYTEGVGWEPTGGYTNPSGTPISYTVPKQSSYSGHFTENITILEDDLLYLVEMDIDYNGEKNIKYYRLLYTSKIFNNYYFNDAIENDYKNIDLQEVLTEYYPITYTASQVNTENTKIADPILLDSNGNEVTENIPSIIDKSEEPLKNYTIKSTFESDVTCEISNSIEIPQFKVTIKNPSVTNVSSEVTMPNAKYKTIDASETPSDISDTPEIKKTSTWSETSIEETTFKGHLQLYLETPFSVEYKPTTTSIEYRLEPLDIAMTWLLVDGYRNSINIYVSSKYSNEKGVLDNCKDTFGDDKKGRKYMELSEYPNVFKEITNMLSINDVLCIYFRTHDSSISGDQGIYTVWGKGLWSVEDARTKFEIHRFYDAKSSKKDGTLCLYAMLDGANQIHLFTYGLTKKETSWYSSKFTETVKGWDNWADNRPGEKPDTIPFAITAGSSTDANSNIISMPFRKYRKPVKNTGAKEIQEWNRILYYNNYTWVNKFTIKCLGEASISINDVEITPDVESPKNLHYKSELQIIIESQIKGKENFDKYTSMVLYPIDTYTLVQSGDTCLKLKDFNKRAIYDDLGNKITYLKKDKGYNTGLIEMDDSRYSFEYNFDLDDKVRLNINNVPNEDKIAIMGRSLELSLAVSGITKV